MHNVTKAKYSLKKQKAQPSVEPILELFNGILTTGQAAEDPQAFLHQLRRAIEYNPDISTFWRLRRWYLGTRSSTEELAEVLSQELSLIRLILKKQPKCYPAWFHLRKLLTHFPRHLRVSEERQFVEGLLFEGDGRNFNAWNYYSFVSSGQTYQVFKFTTRMIEKNFSNYSAWHFRLTDFLNLDRETQLIHEGFFTEPDDQSLWTYYNRIMTRFVGGVLGQTLRGQPLSIEQSQHLKWIGQEISLIKSLIELEPQCTFAIKGLYKLVELIHPFENREPDLQALASAP